MLNSKIWCICFFLFLPSTGLAYDLEFGEKDFGKLVGQVKGMSVLYGEDNGYDPAYTSTTFSRNAYRENVNAWGVRGKYEFIKGLTFRADYVDYGKSDSVGSVGGVGEGLTAIDDAIEWYLTLV